MKKFKIREGKHSSGFHFGLNIKPKMVKYFKFNDDCISEYINEDSRDYNKLIGFSIGYHHHDSYRIVWRPSYKGEELAGSGNLIELAGYQYDRGIRNLEKFCTIKTGIIYKAEITTNNLKTTYIIYEDGKEIGRCNIPSFPPKINIFGIGYKLWPFHGGQNKASHDMTIWIG